MLITFSGLDGAGKSTLIERLRKKLEAQDRRVAVYHMYRHVGLYACARFLLARIGGEDFLRSASNEENDSSPRDRQRSAARRLGSAVAWSKTLRQCAYPFDLLIFLGYRLYVERVRGRVLIMDRYFYDTLADVAAGGGWRGARLLARLTPTPHVPIYLDVSPEQACARKGGHTVAYLSRRREAYRTFFPRGRRAVVLDAGGDADATALAMESAVLERMGAR
jgi:thymidylate kinase